MHIESVNLADGNYELVPSDSLAVTDVNLNCTNLTQDLSQAVRPGATGLLIGIECSRVRDRSWMYLISFVTTRIGIELVAV